jgi:hypothetical protein
MPRQSATTTPTTISTIVIGRRLFFGGGPGGPGGFGEYGEYGGGA